MNTAPLNQAPSELEITQVVKLSLDGQKRFAALSKNPPAPTAQMRELKKLPDFNVPTL